MTGVSSGSWNRLDAQGVESVRMHPLRRYVRTVAAADAEPRREGTWD